MTIQAASPALNVRTGTSAKASRLSMLKGERSKSPTVEPYTRCQLMCSMSENLLNVFFKLLKLKKFMILCTAHFWAFHLRKLKGSHSLGLVQLKILCLSMSSERLVVIAHFSL